MIIIPFVIYHLVFVLYVCVCVFIFIIYDKFIGQSKKILAENSMHYHRLLSIVTIQFEYFNFCWNFFFRFLLLFSLSYKFGSLYILFSLYSEPEHIYTKSICIEVYYITSLFLFLFYFVL